MFQQTINLFRRVHTIVGEHPEFFDALTRWYKDATLARKAVRALFRVAGGREVMMSVNGYQVERAKHPRDMWDRIPSWKVPARVLTRGENEIRVWPGGGERLGVRVREASVFQDGPGGYRAIDLTGDQSTAVGDFRLTAVQRAHPGHDGWEVKRGGELVFRLRMARPTPAVIAVELAGDDALAADLCKLTEDVLRRVLARRRELVGHRPGPDVEEALRDLDAFVDLYHSQIQSAISGDEASTLADAIARTGDPDDLIRQYIRPRRPAPQRPTSPPRPLPRRASTPAPAAGGVGVVKGLVFLVIAGVLAVPVALAAWGDPELWKKVSGWIDGLKNDKQVQHSPELFDALRASADDMGWKRDGEKTFDQDHERKMAEKQGVAAKPFFDGPMQFYAVGERGAGQPAGLAGPDADYLAWGRLLGVIDPGTEAAAEQFLAGMLEQYRANGLAGEEFAVPGANRAVVVRPPIGNPISYARQGRYVLVFRDGLAADQGREMAEARRAFETLAARLKAVGGRPDTVEPPAPKAPGIPNPPAVMKEENREGVLGVPVPRSGDPGK